MSQEHKIKEHRVNLKIYGRVQGVFFRQSTRDQALLLGLTGWVKNETDGTVVVRASGNKDRLEDLIAWCWQGPPSAYVLQVQVEWLEADQSSFEKDFQILK